MPTVSTSWLDALIGPTSVLVEGVEQTLRPAINFIGATAVDNPTAQRTDLTFTAGAPATETTTVPGTIVSASTWTAATAGVTCAANKTTALEVECTIRRTSNGVSACFRRCVCVEYTGGSWGFVGTDATTIAGCTIADEAYPGYDLRLQLNSGTGALAFHAYAPAAATFKVRYRKTEVD